MIVFMFSFEFVLWLIHYHGSPFIITCYHWFYCVYMWHIIETNDVGWRAILLIYYRRFICFLDFFLFFSQEIEVINECSVCSLLFYLLTVSIFYSYCCYMISSKLVLSSYLVSRFCLRCDIAIKKRYRMYIHDNTCIFIVIWPGHLFNLHGW